MYTVPTIAGNSAYTNWQQAPDAAFWTGIGENNLVQAGTAVIATKPPNYRFWTEDYPNPPVFEGPVIPGGDTAYVYVQYLGNSQAYYYLANETTGTYQAFTNPAPYDGWKTAMFINERAKGYYLPSFGSSTFSSNYFGTSSNTYALNTTNNNRVDMTSDGTSTGTPLSTASAVDNSNTSFTVTFNNASPYCS